VFSSRRGSNLEFK